MNEKSILALFEQRDEQGIREASRAYGGLLKTIAVRILGDGRDAEECVNDTMLKAWQSIPPKKPLHFRAYLAKVARNLALNRYEAEHSQMRGGGAVPAALDELGDYEDAAELARQARYEYALTLADEGRHREAAELFDALGHFQNSQQKTLEEYYLGTTGGRHNG